MASDCNAEIIEMIKERMARGRETYGHGLIQRPEARKHGLKEYDWLQESLEEALDLSIYLTAKLIEMKQIEHTKDVRQ